MFATGMIPFCDAVIWVEYEDEKGKKRAKSFCVRLSAQFVSYARKHRVPIDFSVYTQIQSPVCKDLYVWCCYRANSITEDKPLYISRRNMVEQFMPVKDGDIKAESDNWSVIMSHLREIRDKWYPGLRVEFTGDNGGIYFYNSPLVIEDNDKVSIIGAPQDSQEFFRMIGLNTNQVKSTLIIGGASVYRQFLPYMDLVHVTKIDSQPRSDSFFENLDASPDWRVREAGEWQEEDGLRFRFMSYERV